MTPTLTFLIFSKDRALQLHGLLRSLERHCREPVDIFVLYKATNERQILRYSKALSTGSPEFIINPIPETRQFDDLTRTILTWVRTPLFAFLVDDIVFVRPFRPSSFLKPVLSGTIASLRLGRNINYSYMADKTMIVPKLRSKNEFLSWRWNEGGLDWTYPLSVDGNIFRTVEIGKLLKKMPFSGPNSLEANLQDFVGPYRRRRGICFPDPVLVNIPANKVQTEIPTNRSGSESAENLDNLWDQGFRLDVSRYDSMTCDSVHVQTELHLIKESE